VFGSVPISRLARADVKTLLLALRSKSLGHRTVTGILRTLSTVLSEAVEDGKLQANPALRPGRLRRQLRDPNAPKKAAIDPYTREEVEQLVETARRHFPAWHAFLLCAVRTGLRLGEMRALEWGDLDWRQRFLRVQRNFVEGAVTTPKSGRARKVDCRSSSAPFSAYGAGSSARRGFYAAARSRTWCSHPSRAPRSTTPTFAKRYSAS
jgi:integrase